MSERTSQDGAPVMEAAQVPKLAASGDPTTPRASGDDASAIAANPPVPPDRIAELYHGEIMTEETAEIARRRIHWICSQCAGQTVLDIGCSQGITAVLLAREGVQVTGLDTQTEAIRYAQAATDRELPAVRQRLRWIVGDLSHPALLGQTFDTLLLGEVIEHQALPARFLERALLYARPGTRVVLTTPFGLHPHPDHKVELFPRHLHVYAEKCRLVIEHMEVVDGYMRMTACVQSDHAGGPSMSADQLLSLTQDGALASQTALYGRLDGASTLIKSLQSSQKIDRRKLAAATQQAQAAEVVRADIEARLKQAESQIPALANALDEAKAHVGTLTKELAAQRQAAEVDSTNASRELRDAKAQAAKVSEELAEQVRSAEEASASAARALLEAQAEASTLRDELTRQSNSAGQSSEQLAQQIWHARLAESFARSCALHEVHQSNGARPAEDAMSEFIAVGPRIANEHAGRVRESFSFQLGNALLQAARSPRKLVRLPATIARLARSRPARQAAVDSAKLSQEAIRTFDEKGLSASIEVIVAGSDRDADRAEAFRQLADHLTGRSPVLAELAARQAYALDPSPGRAKRLAFQLNSLGRIAEPLRLLCALPPETPIAEPEKRRRAVIGQAWLSAHLPTIFEGLGTLEYQGADSVVFVDDGASSAGEAFRQFREGMPKLAGSTISVPFDPEATWSAMESEDPTHAAGGKSISPRRLSEKVLDRLLGSALASAGRVIEREVRGQQAGAIAVAIDSPIALPAVWVARRLGIALICLLRQPIGHRHGQSQSPVAFDELALRRSSRDRFVLDHAKAVVTSSTVLAWHCRPRLRDSVQLVVAPRAAGAAGLDEAAAPSTATGSQPLILGFAGILSVESGIENLLHATAQIKKRGIDVRLKIAGDGPLALSVQSSVDKLRLTEQVELLGYRNDDQASADLADAHVVVFPSLLQGLADLAAPPLFEVMGRRGQWIVCSDLPGLLDAARAYPRTVAIEAGNRRQLADALSAIHRGERDAALAGSTSWNAGHAARMNWADVQARLRKIIGVARATAEDSDPAVPANGVQTAQAAADRRHWRKIYREHGPAGVVERTAIRGGAHAEAEARELIHISRLLIEAGHPEAEFPLVKAAADHKASAYTLQALFWGAQRAKQFVAACAAVRQLEEVFGPEPDARQQTLIERFRRSPVRMLDVIAEAKSHGVQPIEPVAGRICYVLHNTLPYTSGGYATRSHGIATGLKAQGWDVVVLSRPGYPADLKPEGSTDTIPPVDTVDDIPYVRTLSPRRRPGLSSRAYVLESAAALEERIRQHRPSLVMAASNYITALPALIAARRTGVPFVYDVRGFWEITRLSREPDYEKNANYDTQRVLEGQVAKEADHVFTLTEPMREELAERGVPPEKIDLFPNSCDPTKFRASGRDADLAVSLGIPGGVTVIGYIGTFVDYEGLDDLAEACAQLKREGVEFRLLLVGNENTSSSERGPIMERIQQLAEEAGFADWLIMPGRIPHDQVEAHYSLIDIAPFPRKPWPVCEMVSPMKPLEAMAMEKAVLVSSVRALREMVSDGGTGLVFDKGDIQSLANTLRVLITDTELRKRLGQAGKRWVEEERSWAKTTERFTQRCNQLFGFRLGQP
jgi:glycosyltransferase involved in cell wall biosynthesis/SAM-dependent methyltransferase